MKIYFLLVLIFLPIEFISAQNCTLKIKISNLDERSGNISIGLFNNPESFPKKESGKIGVNLPINDSLVIHTFMNLEKGKYALAIFHDENSNGKLDRSIFGWPTEDYVFSNYAEGSFGPPSFEETSFILNDSLFIELKLKE